MQEGDVTQIRINNNLIGIVGLKQIMEILTRDDAPRTDNEVGNEILKLASAKNYIPERSKELYVKAFIREFRKQRGEPFDETPPVGLRVLVLGPGCAQCRRLEMDVREVMAEMKLPGELVPVTDYGEIGKYGVMGVPALVINDKVCCVGVTPHGNKIKEWLRVAIEKAPA
jgi:hypothetical protein